eukprot:COSAG01_NODE_2539_length_7485_cov_49.290650_9_plen_53_part_00
MLNLCAQVLRAISVRTLMKLLSAVALERHVLVVCSDIGTDSSQKPVENNFLD